MGEGRSMHTALIENNTALAALHHEGCALVQCILIEEKKQWNAFLDAGYFHKH